MISQRAIDAIESSDTDDLLRVVEVLVHNHDWPGLIALRERCAEAVSRGKQVWGVEEHIRYRLVLHGPPQVAGPVVSEGEARFAHGPLPEVAASTKSWSEMAPYLAQGPERSTFAAERVVRGETIEDERTDLPGHLFEWEPQYSLASYKPDKVDAPTPTIPSPEPVELPKEATTIDDPHSEHALADLVETWTDQSNGRCQTVTVEGDRLDAVRALGLSRARGAAVEPANGLAWFAWAGASGGAYGRRRGAAAGRYLAWWAVANLADLDWPADPGTVGEATQRLRWLWFDDGSPDVGWVLRIAIDTPDLGIAWAISAVDIA